MQKSELSKFELPDVPGVYLFKQGRKVLYIGKATSLRDRVRSYFDDDLIATRGPRIVDMVTKADRIAHEPVPTVLEALVREAALIKKYRPSANAEGKDDSTFLYVGITHEEIPRVLTLRGKDIDFSARGGSASGGKVKFKTIYGPFPSGVQLREALRLIRRIFPFFDTPKPLNFARGKPVAQGKHHRAQVAFNQQIGMYPSDFDPVEYRRTIRHLMLFFTGRTKALRKVLAQDMKRFAELERFEEAAEARRQLFALDHIQDVSLIKDENLEKLRSPSTGSTSSPQASSGRFASRRIEAYDTAHLSGTNAIGVMTVVVDGAPVKSQYRTFRIRGMSDVVRLTSDVRRTTSTHGRSIKKLNDDIGSLREILSRRLGHPEWQYPRAIVVDGGKTHKKAAETLLTELGVRIPVVAVVKDERHRPREVIAARRAGISDADAVLANAEAHRFSLALHRKSRSRNLRTS